MKLLKCSTIISPNCLVINNFQKSIFFVHQHFSSINFLHQFSSTFNQLSLSIDLLHQSTFFIIPCQSTFFVSHLSMSMNFLREGVKTKKSCNIVTTYVGGRTGNYTKFVYFFHGPNSSKSAKKFFC